MTDIKITKDDFECLFWTQLKDYPEYEINIYGNVRNIKSKMWLVNRQKRNGGLFYVTIKYHGLFKNIPIHTLNEVDDPYANCAFIDFYEMYYNGFKIV